MGHRFAGPFVLSIALAVVAVGVAAPASGAVPVSGAVPPSQPPDVTPPTAPGAPVAHAVGPNTVTLTWAPSTDDVAVVSYEISIAVTDVVFIAGRTTQTTFTVPSLQAATLYHFAVRARDAAGHPSPQSPYTTVVTAPGPGGQPFAVDYQNVDWASAPDLIRPSVELLNAGAKSVKLSRLTMRYWFTRDAGPGAIGAYCDAAVIGCANTKLRVVTPHPARPGADRYLEVGFKAAAGTLAANQTAGSISLRMRKADGSAFLESNDFSAGPPAPAPYHNGHVTVYLDGELVAGQEP
jgi:cellulose 1,4-beta-cellobiosidase